MRAHEIIIPIKIERLPEGGYLATSNILEGLIAEGRTIAETMEIAQDVAKKLIESYLEHGDPLPKALGITKEEEDITNVQIPVAVNF